MVDLKSYSELQRLSLELGIQHTGLREVMVARLKFHGSLQGLGVQDLIRVAKDRGVTLTPGNIADMKVTLTKMLFKGVIKIDVGITKYLGVTPQELESLEVPGVVQQETNLQPDEHLAYTRLCTAVTELKEKLQEKDTQIAHLTLALETANLEVSRLAQDREQDLKEYQDQILALRIINLELEMKSLFVWELYELARTKEGL